MKLKRIKPGLYKIGCTKWYIKQSFFNDRAEGWDVCTSPDDWLAHTGMPEPTIRDAKNWFIRHVLEIGEYR